MGKDVESADQPPLSEALAKLQQQLTNAMARLHKARAAVARRDGKVDLIGMMATSDLLDSQLAAAQVLLYSKGICTPAEFHEATLEQLKLRAEQLEMQGRSIKVIDS